MNIHVLQYIRIPNLSLLRMQRLAKTLIRDRPDQTNDAIDMAAADLESHIKTVDAALTSRLQASNTELLKSEGNFDRATDGLWLYLIRVLESAEAYAHPGLDALPEELAVTADLAAARAIAAKARRLRQRLFGSLGGAFTQYSYVEQVESMAAIHRLISDEGLRDELVAVVGPQLPTLLEACQQHYETMVSNRLGREQNLVGDLRELRHELRWCIVQYNNAICTLLRRDQPETEKVVEQALRAVISVRARNRVSSDRSTEEMLDELDTPDDELGELEVPNELDVPAGLV
ncbi:hypothetical protein, partial [Enhygromyxa salina]|uniref:hypothetical protein n=1 Tax=Enhygromyxa salina TaxID=215803 RepID=UPI0011B28CC3